VFSVQFLADEIEPTNLSYEDDGVVVEIIAGLARVPADDDDDPEASPNSETDYYGCLFSAMTALC